MKICLISNLYPPSIIGGAEVVVEKVANEFVKRGHDVIVITTNAEGRTVVEDIGGVIVYRINPLNLYNFYNHQKQSILIKPVWHFIDLWNPHPYIKVKNILKKEMPDIVNVHNFKGLSLSVFSAVKSLNIPLVFTAHDYSLICLKANLLNKNHEICTDPSKLCTQYNKIQKYLVNSKPDIITAPSEFIIKQLKDSGLFDGIKTIKLPLGIPLINEKKEKSYEIIDILYVGALSKHKGVHILINAFKGLKNKRIRLHILGKGSDEDELKKNSSSDERIIFHGFKEGDELIKFYQRMNITIVPSIWYDNSPMVIYESLRNATPVIGSKIGGIPELIEEDYNGFLFEAGNVDELKEILRKLIFNPSKLMKLEQGAFESVKKYSMEKHIIKLENIYNELI